MLLLGKRRRQDIWIEQTQVGNRVFVRSNVVVRNLSRAPVGLILHVGVVDVVGETGGVDIALNRLRFFQRAVWLHGELLHQHRPRRANSDGSHQHQHHGQARDTQILDHDRHEESHSHQRRNHDQNDLGGQIRVQVGKRSAGENIVLVKQNRVAIQEIAGNLHQHPQPGDHSELDASRLGY